MIHESPSSGHPGITATVHLVPTSSGGHHYKRTLPSLSNTVLLAVFPNLLINASWVTSTSTYTSTPLSHIAIDFVTDLPRSRNHTTILTVIDRFSKACRLIPLTKLPTAFETAEALLEQVFRFYGLPEVYICVEKCI